MKEILLTRGFVALVDDEDYERLAAHRWFINAYGYAMRNSPHPIIAKKRTPLYMHRDIAGLSRGDARQVDHIDRNRLNNQRSNLRICTLAENSINRISSRNTSGLKGVSWHGRDRVWRAQIEIGGTKIHLGSFQTPQDAYEAYCNAAKELHGEFANVG